MTSLKIDLTDLKAAIFDMDGTIVDNMEYHKIAWKRYFSELGIMISDEEFKKKISGKNNRDIFKTFLKPNLTQNEIDYHGKKKEEIYRNIYYPHITPIQGLNSLLKKIKTNGVKLAIATTAIKENRDFILKNLGLKKEFDLIVGNEDISNGKPHPEIYLKTAQKLGISPSRCIVFEDTPSGIKSAKKAGMKTFALSTTHAKKDLIGADIIINDFSGIILT